MNKPPNRLIRTVLGVTIIGALLFGLFAQLTPSVLGLQIQSSAALDSSTKEPGPPQRKDKEKFTQPPEVSLPTDVPAVPTDVPALPTDMPVLPTVVPTDVPAVPFVEPTIGPAETDASQTSLQAQESDIVIAAIPPGCGPNPGTTNDFSGRDLTAAPTMVSHLPAPTSVAPPLPMPHLMAQT
jgi:hypothetical protein